MATLVRGEHVKSGVRHTNESGNFEDQTAFGDDLDIGDESEKKDHIDFAPNASEEQINFAMDDQYLQQKWRRELIRSVTKTLAVTLGLLCACFAFCFLGGYMFNSMEMYNEVQTCKSNRNKYYSGMSKAQDAITTTASNFQLSQSERLSQYRTALDTFVGVFHNSSWKGDNCDTYSPLWSFTGATFFCVTVITSIGYGYIAPVTFWGRCVLIAYAVIGIPMYLAALANIGSFCSAVTHYAYHSICCCGVCRKLKIDKTAKKQMKSQMIALWRTEPNPPSAAFLEAIEESSDEEYDNNDDDGQDETATELFVPVPVSLLILSSVIIFGGSIFSHTESWSFLDATYFSFISIATIGFGDLVPGLVNTNTERQTLFKYVLTWCYIVFGMIILSMSLQLIQENIQGTVKNMLKHFSAKKQKNLDGAVKENNDSSDSDASDDDGRFNGQGNNVDQMEQRLPGPGDWGANLRFNYNAFDNTMDGHMMGGPMSSISLHYGANMQDRDSAVPSSGVRGYHPNPPPFFNQPPPGPPPPMFMRPPPTVAAAYGEAPMTGLMRPPPTAMSQYRGDSSLMRPPPSAVSARDEVPQSAASQRSDYAHSSLMRPAASAVSNRADSPGSATSYRSDHGHNSMMRPPPSATSTRDEVPGSATSYRGMMRPPPSAMSTRDEVPGSATSYRGNRAPPSATSTRDEVPGSATSYRGMMRPPPSAMSTRDEVPGSATSYRGNRAPPSAVSTRDEPPSSSLRRPPPSATSQGGYI